MTRIKKAKFPRKYLNLIAKYKDKSLDELRLIKPRWAIGEYQKHSTAMFRVMTKNSLIYYVSVKELVELVDFGDMDFAPINPFIMFNGALGRDVRVVATLDHWNNGGFIDPPEIAIDNYRKIFFSDGRHRTVAAYNLGVDEIPVAIDILQVQEFQKVLKITKFE